jgi:hypothetical protein
MPEYPALRKQWQVMLIPVMLRHNQLLLERLLLLD